MSTMVITRRPSSLLLLSTLTLFVATRISCQEKTCDDGKYMVDKDLGGEENWRCLTEEYASPKVFMKPAGSSQCNEETSGFTFKKCMEEDISYSGHPPLIGNFRPLAPMYGDYEYLPPQRWMHSLKLGALAFLYHPCAPTEQVLELKELARSCLWQHVITPYPHLTEDKPLAIVSWGCVYRMSWVNGVEATEWIKQHALKVEGSSSTHNGDYKEGLLRNATPSDDDHICGERSHDPAVPDQPTQSDIINHHSPSPSSNHNPPVSNDHETVSNDHATSTPCQQRSNSSTNEGEDSSNEKDKPCSQSTEEPPQLTVHVSHGSTLTVLIVLLCLVLFVALLIVLWRLGSFMRNRCCAKKRQARYKSVSKFFPFSYGQESAEGVAIPEYGLPKGRAAEREVLLNDSDEDEL